MQIKQGFVLRQIGDTYMVVAIGVQTLDFQGMIRLNETGAFLWQRLSETSCTEDVLVQAMIAEYDVDAATAASDVSDFVNALKDADLLQ